MLLPCASPDDLEAGIDEAGRGSLAGPVVAAAVVWNPELDDGPMTALVRDSKRLSRAQRERVRAFIMDNAVAHAVAFVPNERIDEINILNATYEAMHAAVDALNVQVDRLLVDGDRFKVYMSPCGMFVPHTCVVDGDNTYMSIAAASILAKTFRDDFMRGVVHVAHPEYGFDSHVGYGSARHMDALRRLGPTPFHRLSYAPVFMINRSRAGDKR